MKSLSSTLHYSSRWDLVGTCGSTLCVAHCILTPILITLIPLAGIEVLESETIHKGLVLGVVAIGILAFGPGFLMHRRKLVLGVMGLGLSLLAMAAFGVEPVLPVSSHEWAETILTMAGGVTMVTAHLLNRSFCRTCTDCS